MKIYCNDTYSTLREVIVGKLHISAVANNPHNELLTQIVAETNQELDNIVTNLEKFGVKVHRPGVDVDFGKQWSNGYITVTGSNLPLSPRDLFFVYQDKIIVTNNFEQNRYFEHLCYEDILVNYMDQGSSVISMPQPQDPDSNFPIASAANFQKYHEHIFYSSECSANTRGIQWFKNMLGKEYEFHELPLSGHVDARFNIVGDRTVVTNLAELPEFFNEWNVISGNFAPINDVQYISEHLQDDDAENTDLNTNVFNIDPQHIMLFDTTPNNIVSQLENDGYIPVPVKLSHAHFLNQGLTCMILDTVRF